MTKKYVVNIARLDGRAMLKTEWAELSQFAETYQATITADVRKRYEAALQKKKSDTKIVNPLPHVEPEDVVLR